MDTLYLMTRTKVTIVFLSHLFPLNNILSMLILFNRQPSSFLLYNSASSNQCVKNNFLARQAEDLKIVCYYGAWSVYRPAPFNFSVTNIDPFSCTHLIYSFAGLEPDSLTIMSLDTEEDITKGGLRSIEMC